MIVFTPVRTRRLHVQLTELTINDVIHLCKMPGQMNEAGTTELLRRVVKEDLRPRVGQVTDVTLWTVQERALVAAHYIAHTNEGDPDFPIGDGRFSDYIMDGTDFAPTSTNVGEVEGDKWTLRPLLGIHAEAIERLVASGRLESARHGWWLGAMAAQLFRDGEDVDQSSWTEAAIEEHIDARATTLKGYPESAFMTLLMLYLAAIKEQNHLFRIGFSDDGIAFLPKEAGLPPARFPFGSSISKGAEEVFGNA